MKTTGWLWTAVVLAVVGSPAAGQATDPLKQEARDVLCPRGAYTAMKRAYEMAGLQPDDVNVAE